MVGNVGCSRKWQLTSKLLYTLIWVLIKCSCCTSPCLGHSWIDILAKFQMVVITGIHLYKKNYSILILFCPTNIFDINSTLRPLNCQSCPTHHGLLHAVHTEICSAISLYSFTAETWHFSLAAHPLLIVITFLVKECPKI